MTRQDALQLGRRYVRDHARLFRRAAIVGSVLREHDEVHDVDLVVVPRDDAPIPKVTRVNVFRTTAEAWEAAVLQYAPGKATIGLRAEAKRRGYLLNQYGLWDAARTDVAVCPCRAESICAMLGVPVPEAVRRSLDGTLVVLGANASASR